MVPTLRGAAADVQVKAERHVEDGHTIEQLQEHSRRVIIEEHHGDNEPVVSTTTTIKTEVRGGPGHE